MKAFWKGIALEIGTLPFEVIVFIDNLNDGWGIAATLKKVMQSITSPAGAN